MVHTNSAEKAAVSCGTSHVTKQKQEPHSKKTKVHHFRGYQKHTVKIQSLIWNHLRQTRSESARERQSLSWKHGHATRAQCLVALVPPAMRARTSRVQDDRSPTHANY